MKLEAYLASRHGPEREPESVQAFAERIGVPRRTIYNILKRTSRPLAITAHTIISATEQWPAPKSTRGRTVTLAELVGV